MVTQQLNQVDDPDSVLATGGHVSNAVSSLTTDRETLACLSFLKYEMRLYQELFQEWENYCILEGNFVEQIQYCILSKKLHVIIHVP